MVLDHRVAKQAKREARAAAAAKVADLEAVEHVEHVPCQKCKNVELPPAYENVEADTLSVHVTDETDETNHTNHTNQAEPSKSEKGPVVGPMPLNASQSGLSVVDDEGRIVGA